MLTILMAFCRMIVTESLKLHVNVCVSLKCISMINYQKSIKESNVKIFPMIRKQGKRKEKHTLMRVTKRQIIWAECTQNPKTGSIYEFGVEWCNTQADCAVCVRWHTYRQLGTRRCAVHAQCWLAGSLVVGKH